MQHLFETTPRNLTLGLLALVVAAFTSSSPVNAEAPGALPLTGIDGTDRYSATVCAGSSICFDVFTQPDKDVQIRRWVGDLPNALFELLNAQGNSGHLCWTPGEQDAREEPYRFTIFAGTENTEVPVEYTLLVPHIQIRSVTKEISCKGMDDGQILLESIPAVDEYFYTWSDTPGQTPERDHLKAGSYLVVISDPNGCSIEREFVLDEPEALTTKYTVIPSDCRIVNGRIKLEVSGGTWPYQYDWNGLSGSEPELGPVAEGYYGLALTDANGCSLRDRIHVPSAALMVQNAKIQPASCPEQADGSASITINGGTAPYEIEWFPYGGSAQHAAALTAGLYTVQVADAAGCSATLELSIEARSQSPKLEMPATIEFCQGSQVALSAGNAWHTVEWSDGSRHSSLSVNRAGKYSVSVTDDHGCQQQSTIVATAVNCNDQRSARPTDSPLLRVSPNPAGDLTTVLLDPEYPESTTLFLSDALGRQLQVITPRRDGAEIEIPLRNYPAGTYLLTILQPSGSETIRLIKY